MSLFSEIRVCKWEPVIYYLSCTAFILQPSCCSNSFVIYKIGEKPNWNLNVICTLQYIQFVWYVRDPLALSLQEGNKMLLMLTDRVLTYKRPFIIKIELVRFLNRASESLDASCLVIRNDNAEQLVLENWLWPESAVAEQGCYYHFVVRLLESNPFRTGFRWILAAGMPLGYLAQPGSCHGLSSSFWEMRNTSRLATKKNYSHCSGR